MNIDEMKLRVQRLAALLEAPNPDDLAWEGMAARAAKEIAGEPSFEEAEKIVKERMVAEVEKLAERSDSYMPYVQLDVTKFYDGIKQRWMAKVEMGKDLPYQNTLDDALAALPQPMTAEEKKAARIAELEAALDKLKGEL